ncbi:hypothetical protein [Microbacterium sp. 5K110]|uniref:hypothetical protein n=1 Tax=unclassified Microbacterium TaxID=2609290 RepID=UPI0010FE2E0D|nr:hypothetical protein [Microbacterium sp. 5K110]TLF33080.1 hypothetical protein FE256_04255 [Microbacterium sp. 5K110]
MTTTAAPRRLSRAGIVGIAVGAVALIGIGVGGLVLFGWMVDETHFDRPSAEFDALETEVLALPGVETVEKERWVEAPTFANPTSSMRVTLDRAALPSLLDTACSSGYPDPVMWGLAVRTPSDAEVSVFADPVTSAPSPGCPDFGLDLVATVDALDALAPGRSIQAAIWENGRLSFSDLFDVGSDVAGMVPLVEAADELRRTAGVDPDAEVEISGPMLTAVVAPGDASAYAALLRTLVDDYGVTTFWDGAGGGTPIDGVAKTQVRCDPEDAAAVETAIRASGLPLADAPILFRED